MRFSTSLRHITRGLVAGLLLYRSVDSATCRAYNTSLFPSLSFRGRFLQPTLLPRRHFCERSTTSTETTLFHKTLI